MLKDGITNKYYNQCDRFLHSILKFFSWKVLSKNVLKVFDTGTAKIIYTKTGSVCTV